MRRALSGNFPAKFNLVWRQAGKNSREFRSARVTNRRYRFEILHSPNVAVIQKSIMMRAGTYGIRLVGKDRQQKPRSAVMATVPDRLLTRPGTMIRPTAV